MVKQEIYNKVYEDISSYLLRILVYRRYEKRPMELKILDIAKTLGYSYKQVRTVINKMLKTHLIEKFTAWSTVNINGKEKYLRRTFYRRV